LTTTNELVTSATTATTPFRNFIESCKSPATRTIYTQGLHYYMNYLGIDRNSYDKLLRPGMDYKMIEMDIKEYIIHLQQNKKTASATIASYIAALVKFYTMNHIMLNWKWIKSFMGEHEKVAEDKPYTHAEIQTLLTNTDTRNRAIILTMCSSGMDNMYIRRLMGHKSKSNLEEAYLKISDEELLEGDSKHVVS
jgi:hypothetical protein